jgi:hypothetical protein
MLFLFRRRLAAGLAALAVLAPAAVMAKPLTYVCALNVPAEQDWVPSQVVIRLEPGATTGLVNDPIIRNFAGKPLPAEVVVDNASRITFRWTLKMVTNHANQTAPNFVYRATILKAGLSVRISAKPLGYDNFFEAGGTCTTG